MISGLCLSFLAAHAGGAAPIPESVARLARAQVESQFRAARPDARLLFDDPDCPDQGRYEFTADSLVLSSERSLWMGRREYPLSDLIEGKKIEIPSAPDSSATSLAIAARMREAPPASATGRLLGGAALGALAGAGSGAAFSPNAASRGTNALVFGLSGAIAGAFLSVLWAEL